ncbi:MAG TPA: Gfo/Idh/MocA family oxidoreductase [Caulobacteraceae bacterium]|nr:Gfo/Idh/MocA family oxidoreductase [Caulobacteraceae bacterium]
MTSPARHRHAIVGLGARSYMYSRAILKTYADRHELVGLCDVNRTRMAWCNGKYRGWGAPADIPAYHAADFDRMLTETRPDTVIVTSIDRTHHRYIVQALERGCDVITEKPMTIDADTCRDILAAVERTGRRLRVAFNYRYSPARALVKQLLQERRIGRVRAVNFEWLLDTVHGADYFRRWHRDKRNSGGLMVHKATHHFDLVNWWLDSSPQLVFGLGSLAFYGRANAEDRGLTRFYDRGTDHPNAANDPFALNLADGGALEGLYLQGAEEDGYRRDQSVFGDGISIEDTMNLVVRYRNGVQMSYTLSAYCPWEGYRIAFIGDEGRIELEDLEKSYVSAASGEIGQSASESQKITVFPHWDRPYEVKPPAAVGDHGGGDALLLEDIFGDAPPADPLGRRADHVAGARSILTGIAANQSFATGLPVRVDDLVRLP